MDTLALILSIIGSLNWGLVGIFRFDLVAWLFGGQGSVISRIIFTLVGLAGFVLNTGYNFFDTILSCITDCIFSFTVRR